MPFLWDDLKLLLALARHGSTLAASRALGIDQSTVQRRLTALERSLGQALIRREAAGYRLTAFGASLLPYAEQVERATAEFARAAGAGGDDLAGVIRVTCPEPIMARLADSPLLDRFRALHPGLSISFVTSDRYIDLRSGEADIALRSGDPDDDSLIGRKIGDSFWAVYGSRRYVAARGAPTGVDGLAGHALIGLDESMAAHRMATWLKQVAPGASLAARSGSILGLVQSVKAGLGLAALPTALGDREDDLLRVFGPVDELTRAWRVLVTPQQRHNPRVAAFFDFVVDEIDALRPILTG